MQSISSCCTSAQIHAPSVCAFVRCLVCVKATLAAAATWQVAIVMLSEHYPTHRSMDTLHLDTLHLTRQCLDQSLDSLHLILLIHSSACLLPMSFHPAHARRELLHIISAKNCFMGSILPGVKNKKMNE